MYHDHNDLESVSFIIIVVCLSIALWARGSFIKTKDRRIGYLWVDGDWNAVFNFQAFSHTAEGLGCARH